MFPPFRRFQQAAYAFFSWPSWPSGLLFVSFALLLDFFLLPFFLFFFSIPSSTLASRVKRTTVPNSPSVARLHPRFGENRVTIVCLLICAFSCLFFSSCSFVSAFCPLSVRWLSTVILATFRPVCRLYTVLCSTKYVDTRAVHQITPFGAGHGLAAPKNETPRGK